MLVRSIVAAGAVAVASFAIILDATADDSDGPTVGVTAPPFSAVDTSGNTVNLDDFLGTPVVLEWTNHDCPYVRKHYNGGNMQKTQRALTDDGAVWLTIVSSAPGKQGHVSANEADNLTASRGAYPSRVLLDPDGTVGRAYRARTTPHMFLIDEQGILQYQGAIDDKPSANLKSLDGASNYVLAAWEALRADQPVADSNTVPYGCSVKY